MEEKVERATEKYNNEVAMMTFAHFVVAYLHTFIWCL